jgi:uncharacterized protein
MAAPAVAANPRGRFEWHDLLTTDPKAAQRFYTQLVGWGTKAWQGPTPYTVWTTGDKGVGGVMSLPPDAVRGGVGPHWLAHIATPDVDATVKQATSLGARVLVPPTDIPTVGRYAVLADPQGASFAVYTGAGGWPGHEGEAAVHEFSWHELATSDPVAAFEFYQALFGWVKSQAMDMGPDGMYQMFDREGIMLGGFYRAPAQQGSPAWLHYIRVDDVDRAAKQIPAAGGRVTRGPMEVPGGSRIVIGVDPQGAPFALHSKAD